MVVNAARDADAAGLSETLESRRDVDTVTKDVPVFHHPIADIDADAKPHTALFAERLVCLVKITLDLDRALYGSKDTGEFGKNAVARCATDSAAPLRNERVCDGSVRRKCRQGGFLVDAH